MHPVSVRDWREAARRRLPPFLFEYIDGGAYDEVTMGRNVSDLAAITLRQRVLRNVATRDTAIDLFGQTWSMPVALGPVGLAGMNARRGEVAAARAAAAFGVPFCLSTVSVCPLAEVAGASPDPFWFQLYMIRDRAFMASLLDRAEAAGCRVLVFTVDMPVPGTRYRDFRSGLAGRPGLAGSARRLLQAASRPRWAASVGLGGRPHTLGNIAPALGGKSGLEDFFAWMRANFDASVTWADLARVRARWSGPLLVKGVLDPDDARAARDAGADGIIVSNHGGRQLDGVVSSVRALPGIVASVGADLPVLADGGIRSGLDVARMLALGARAVLVGRPWAYALGGGGGAGVGSMLGALGAELSVAMALTGATRIAELDQHCLQA